MPWCWELPEWPHFSYDPTLIAQIERQFLLRAGSSMASLKITQLGDYQQFAVEILSSEGLESSKIEGEVLDRESLQISIKQQFGLTIPSKKGADKESKMAQLLCNVYRSFNEPLTHEMLWQWHAILFHDSPHLADRGTYRTHPEPMQIISNRLDKPTVFFEAPPSAKIFHEMTQFIHWFNSKDSTSSILGRAAIAHLYFECIHPFEDGNGRIGRLLAEKVLSQEIGHPILMALSKRLQLRKKEYYTMLERCNRTLDVGHFVLFFSSIVLEAQEDSTNLLNFLIEKSKMMNSLTDNLNPRQTKALLRMFAEGPSGFQKGLTAENYIAITKTTRATATRDLTDLVKKGALVKTGELRHTRYRLNIFRQPSIEGD